MLFKQKVCQKLIFCCNSFLFVQYVIIITIINIRLLKFATISRVSCIYLNKKSVEKVEELILYQWILIWLYRILCDANQTFSQLRQSNELINKKFVQMKTEKRNRIENGIQLPVRVEEKKMNGWRTGIGKRTYNRWKIIIVCNRNSFEIIKRRTNSFKNAKEHLKYIGYN